jgi:hypothetical protein
MVSAEARAHQASLIVSRMPMANSISSAPQLHRPTVYRDRANGNLTADIGNNYDTALSDFNVEVHIERQIIMDARPPDAETTDRDFYTPPKSAWDKATGPDV